VGEIRSYRDLKVRQAAMTLVEECYRFTKGFLKDEMYGLTSQIRRAALSVPANVAEGYGRDGASAYVQFLKTARGSLKEPETHLILSQRLSLGASAAPDRSFGQTAAIGRMVRVPVRRLQNSEGR
jgi:four helix bundle protein